MKTYKYILMPVGLFGVMILGMWLASQWVAQTLHYPVEFGNPLFTIGSTPIYGPMFMVWWYKYGVYVPGVFEKGATAILGSFLITFSIVIIAAVSKAKPKAAPTSHGTARWANDEEIKDSGLISSQGIILGKTDDGQYLRHDGPEHAIMVAPTRSGKGVSSVIPTLLTWAHSLVVTDIKSECWQITAGFRKAKLNNIVLKFEPTSNDGSSVKFNPLDEIRIRTEHEIEDTQNIVQMLVETGGDDKADNSHWIKTASKFLQGVVLHLKYTKQSASLADIGAFLDDPELEFEEKLDLMMATAHEETTDYFYQTYGVESRTHPMVARAAREMKDKPDNERGSVLSTAGSSLGLYCDPIVSKNIAVSEFSIDDLMNNDKPVTLYLVTPPNQIKRLRPLFRMIITLIMDKLTAKMEFENQRPAKSYKHKMLLLIDEFPSLGKLEKVESGLSYMAGYGIKAFLIIQDLNQLYQHYTKNNSIVGNSHIRIFHTPNELDTQKYLSEALGTKTELVENKNISGHWMNTGLGNISVSTQESSRPLLTPGEVGQIDNAKEIIFISGKPPIFAKKIRYYEDKNFTSRLMPVPKVSDKVREAPILIPVISGLMDLADTSMEKDTVYRTIHKNKSEVSPEIECESEMIFGLEDLLEQEDGN